MKLNKVANEVIKEGEEASDTLLSKSKFPKECILRFAELLEMELANPRNQKEIVFSDKLEIFAVYSALVKLTVMFSGKDDSKLDSLHKECLHVAKAIREHEANEIKPTN